MAVQERLGGLRGIGLDEAAVAVGQVDDETVGLALHAADDHQGLAEVALRVARRMGQRDKHIPGLATMLSYIVLDRGVSAVVAVLIPQPLEDARGRVSLLAGAREVILQDAVDDAGERLQLGTPGRGMSLVARRHGVGQHLAHGVPVQTELSGDLPNAHPLHHHRPANRRYDSTWYIPGTIHRFEDAPMDGARRYGIQPLNVSDLSAYVVQFTSADYTLPVPLTRPHRRRRNWASLWLPGHRSRRTL